MLIRFTKSRRGPVLVCLREGGSITGMRNARHGEFFVRHDLMHYAVESTLNLRQAFWGLLAGLDGREPWSIEAFNKPGAARLLPHEAVLAEFIVGRLDQVALFDDKPISAAELNAHLQAPVSGDAAKPLAALTQGQIDRIFECFLDLWSRFQSLPEGGTLELPFPAEQSRVIATAGCPVPR